MIAVAASANMIWNRKWHASSARKKNLPVNVNKNIPAANKPQTRVHFEMRNFDKEIIPNRLALATCSFIEAIH
jgi:hypothetical protein|tara:strand:+ start:452 stop:670 length:219 start_codon:yes stop_codon:yes gene_type:complete